MTPSDKSVCWISVALAALIAITAVFGYSIFRKRLNRIGNERYAKYSRLEMEAIKSSLEEGAYFSQEVAGRELHELPRSESIAVAFTAFLERNQIEFLEATERYTDETGSDYFIVLKNGVGKLIAIGLNGKLEDGGGDDIIVEFDMTHAIKKK